MFLGEGAYAVCQDHPKSLFSVETGVLQVSSSCGSVYLVYQRRVGKESRDKNGDVNQEEIALYEVQSVVKKPKTFVKP